MKFLNKKVIVTGANRSIGRQIAVDFAKQGADVVISYRSQKEAALETVEMIKATGQKGFAFYADFSKMDDVKLFFDNAIASFGYIDILVNNAGMLCREKLFELSPQKMQQVFQVNTISPLYLAQLCAENMVDRKTEGSIINISSISGNSTTPKGIGYAASKAAMNKWTQNAALNLAEYRIRVNTIAPGVVEAGMNQDTATSDPELWDYYVTNIPLGKTGVPADISNMALFLASSEASWITGKIYEVDGGNIL